MNMDLHATLVFAQTDSRDGPLPCRSAQFRPGPPRIGGGDGGALLIDLNMAGLTGFVCLLSLAPGCFLLLQQGAAAPEEEEIGQLNVMNLVKINVV
ncbi:hypothetical protein NEUTE2DRAFT_75715 [Neurospora tetrasperma FGSC 2509]|nr:hypothetical protein NEUTE2DRAFT_75715 [Neurospora tetrasperma FGSC 2509]